MSEEGSADLIVGRLERKAINFGSTDIPVESKREQAKAQTRKAILRSALRLYSLEGACGMSMNKVAKGAGIAQPSFYNHFENLSDLENELGERLKQNYLSSMRSAWIDMLKDYATLNKAQFNERCQHCLSLIFDAAFANISLFQRLLEDSLRCSSKTGELALASSHLCHLINELQTEWTQIFIQGLALSECDFEITEVRLSVDIAAAQVHQLILGCHHQRYSRAQAIGILSQSFNMIFANVLCLKQSNQRELR